MNGILQTVLDSYHHFHPETEVVNGLVSIGMFYAVVALMTWFTPSVLALMVSLKFINSHRFCLT